MSAGAERILIDAVPLSDQENAWREALASLDLSCRIEGPAALRFADVTVRTSPDGTRYALLRASSQEIFAASRNASSSIAIMLHNTGRGRVVRGPYAREFADGDLSVCDLGAGWSMELREDFEILLVEMPRERLRLGRNGVTLPTVLGATVACAAARSVMRTFAANMTDMDLADLLSLEVAVTELVSSALLSEARVDSEPMT